MAARILVIRKQAPEALFHVDGVQAFCKMPFGKPPCDFYSISAHKFHGPKGVGALYVRQGVPFSGGLIGGWAGAGPTKRHHQRSTGIVGMDAALSAYRANQAAWVARMRACKLRLAKNILTIPDTVLNGPAPESGAPHILNASFLGVRGEVLLHALEEKGVYVSTGSACSAHKKGGSRVIAALGYTGARLEGALRFSLCPFQYRGRNGCRRPGAARMCRTATQVQEAVSYHKTDNGRP